MWLLIFLIPLQGIAGSIRSYCSPDHQLESFSSGGVTHHAGNDTLHSRAMMHAQVARADASHTTTGHDDAHQHKSAFCGNCCIGASAPPSKIDWNLSATTVSIDIVSPAPLVTGYIPNGLERPPRHVPA